MLAISNKEIAYNTFYNLLGKVLPILAGIISIPILINKLGLERFGILTLVWSVIGYFGIFDLGIGRATTKFVAEYLALNKLEELPSLIWTSVFFMFSFGLIAGFLAYLTTPWLVTKVFKVSPDLVGETRHAFQLLSFIIPFAISTAGTQGVLEAQQRFSLINAIRTPASLINFLGPLPLLLFTRSLFPIVMLMAGTRLLVWLACFYWCINSLPGMNRVQAPQYHHLKKLLGFGGWIAISNLVSPFMVYMDRFLIGALFTMQAVAYYVTPYELVTKLLHIPSSLMPVLFPAFSAYAAGHEPKLAILHRRAVKYLFLALAPCIVGVIVLAKPFLSVWINPDFAEVSAPIMQLLAVGVMLNAIAWVSQGAIHAMGRPDLTAKLHLVELPVYLGVLWVFIHSWGLIGVALAWVLRVGIDSALLIWWKNRLLAATARAPITVEGRLILGGILLLGGAIFITITPSVPIKVSGLSFIILGIGFLAWQHLLDDQEKEQISFLKAKLLNLLF
jgi:O-antigen/teichoic acid export membrane protein